MTHEERAKKFFDDAGSDALPSIEAALAEQFREVEREERAMLRRLLGEEMAELRLIAASAKRGSGYYDKIAAFGDVLRWLDNLDAATKGIER